MNITLNSFAPTPAALDAALVTASVAGADARPAASAAPALAAAAPAAFAQWLGLGQQVDAAAWPADAAVPVAENAGSPETDAVESAGQPTAPADQEVVVLAAMSMSLMAPPPAPVFTRGAAAAPADRQSADAAPGAALPLTAAELRTGLATAAVAAAGLAVAAAGVTMPAAGVTMPAAGVTMPAAGVAVPPPATPRGAGAAADPLPAAEGARPVPAQAVSALAVPAQPVSAPAMPAQSVPAQSVPAEARVAAPVQAAAPTADAKPGADAIQAADDSAAPPSERAAGAWAAGAAAPAPASARLGADSVALSGPPTAWRQTLHEALGERLNLQLSNRAEQAVIRLEPPMLGRVDIAIRHSAGALEVTISATHGEVLRQLHAVSENLRSDLAQRQFSEVAVTVTPAPRGAQAAPHGEQQGRGRQPAREDQPQDPGRSLAEASDPSSTFSLNGRA